MSFSLLANARKIQSLMPPREEAATLARLGNALAEKVGPPFSIRLSDRHLACPNYVCDLEINHLNVAASWNCVR